MKSFYFLLTTLLTISISAQAKSETFAVDTSSSTLNWTGKKIGGAHNGTLMIKSGKIQVEKNQITGGEIQIDMTSLKDLDLTDAEYNQKLTKHLHSDDFFSIEKFPTASLVITKSEKGANPNELKIYGDLTIKGIKKPIVFDATTGINKDDFTSDAKLTIDRTLFDIKYRSGKFFANLGDKVIHDEFTLETHLVAKKEATKTKKKK